jgi:sugar O-acyltransferase (sialic acid O-acetyltransferase NeuD family)
MKRVVIIGAGGQAREVAAIIRHQSQSQCEIRLLGFVVEPDYIPGDGAADLPILGDWSWFKGAERGDLAVVCAVGDPALRKRLVDQAISIGLSFSNVISPLAYVSSDAKIGQGVMIFPFAAISTNCFLGDHTIINTGSTISHDTIIDRYGTIAPGVHAAGNVSLGEGCYLGIGSSVKERISIGAWTIIGAGSVVIRDVPDNVTVVGVPAKIIKTSIISS